MTGSGERPEFETVVGRLVDIDGGICIGGAVGGAIVCGDEMGFWWFVTFVEFDISRSFWRSSNWVWRLFSCSKYTVISLVHWVRPIRKLYIQRTRMFLNHVNGIKLNAFWLVVAKRAFWSILNCGWWIWSLGMNNKLGGVSNWLFQIKLSRSMKWSPTMQPNFYFEGVLSP